MNPIAAFFARYLRGVKIAPLLTLIPGGTTFYGWLVTSTHLSPLHAGIATGIVLLVIVLAYLFVPKDQQALALNLLEEGARAQAKNAVAAQSATQILAIAGQVLNTQASAPTDSPGSGVTSTTAIVTSTTADPASAVPTAPTTPTQTPPTTSSI